MDRLEVHQDALQPGSRVMIVDDLLVERRVLQLVQQIDCELVGFGFTLSSSRIYKGVSCSVCG